MEDYHITPPKKRIKPNSSPSLKYDVYHVSSHKRSKVPEATVTHGNRLLAKACYGDELKPVAVYNVPSRCSSVHSVIIIPDGDDDNIITMQSG